MPEFYLTLLSIIFTSLAWSPPPRLVDFGVQIWNLGTQAYFFSLCAFLEQKNMILSAVMVKKPAREFSIIFSKIVKPMSQACQYYLTWVVWWIRSHCDVDPG